MSEGDLQTADRQDLEARVRYLQDLSVKIQRWVDENPDSCAYSDDDGEYIYGHLVPEDKMEELEVLVSE